MIGSLEVWLKAISLGLYFGGERNDQMHAISIPLIDWYIQVFCLFLCQFWLLTFFFQKSNVFNIGFKTIGVWFLMIFFCGLKDIC